MIKIPKKQSFNSGAPISLKLFSLSRIIIYIVLILFFYIALPLYLSFRSKTNPLYIFFFYLSNCVISFLLYHKHARRLNRLNLKKQDIQEQINILTIQHKRQLKNKDSLSEKIKRYNSLKNIIEEINQSLSLEHVSNSLSEIAFSLIGSGQGSCILYLVDPKTHRLSLFKTKKEDHRLIIKAKEGDAFDIWILRHSSPLFIEDTKKDFRFDLEKIKSEDARTFSSLISAPLISENRFLGILRLDHHLPGFFSQDDLRFLVTISELGAVAIENGELFQKTQDLAIHDGLTLLYTKGYFLERLKEECKRSLRHNVNLSLLMLDIDYFKNYNDKFGHTAGDIVLQKLSSDMSEFLEDKDPIVSRFGGEEFCIMLPRTDKEKAMAVAQQLCARIEKLKIILRRQETAITVSVGVCSLPSDTTDEDELIIKADQAMYSAKQKGRNRVCSV